MMFFLFTLLCLSAPAVYGRDFTNPILAGSALANPHVIKVDSVYYLVVSSVNASVTDKFSLHVSNDLKSWTRLGSIFNANNPIPRWARDTNLFNGPEIHSVGGKFILYFTTLEVTSLEPKEKIGFAVADRITGPYIAAESPLEVSSNAASYPTLAIDNNNVYMFWNESLGILGKKLTADGQDVGTDETSLLLLPQEIYEGYNIVSPNFFKRGSYYYIFYTVSGLECAQYSGISVARSTQILGPYEKYPEGWFLYEPTMEKFKGHTSLIKDIDGQSDVLIYNALTTGDCTNRNLFARNIAWGADNWPFVV